MNRLYFSVCASLFCSLGSVWGQSAHDNLTLTDLVLPIQGQSVASDSRGNDNVRYRFADNGFEDPETIIWGGDVIKADDGLFHMFACSWNQKFGHKGYKSNSDVVHAVSQSPSGPFTLKERLGKGFDPEVFRLADGTFVVKAWTGQYVSKDINGPWTFEEMKFETRGRFMLKGAAIYSLSNMSFTERPDHSFLAVDRGGAIWASQDGLRNWSMITDKSVFVLDRIKEDPVIWHDDVQYYLLERNHNDYTGNFYRSIDGVHWTYDEFFYYRPGLIRHADGQVEEWKDIDRWKVVTDDHGRAEFFSVAVSDVDFSSVKANDGHVCKNVVIPVVKSKFLQVASPSSISPETSSIDIIIKGEDDFCPAKEVNLKSLSLGSHNATAYGKGLKAVKSKKSGKNDLIVTFAGAKGDLDISADEWALRMVGKTKKGKIIHGYAAIPGHSMSHSFVLNALMPQVDENDVPSSIVVENFGVAASAPAVVNVCAPDGTLLSSGSVAPILPFANAEVPLKGVKNIPLGSNEIKVNFLVDNKVVNQNTIAIRNVNAFQERLVALVDSARSLGENETYKQGQMDLQMAMMEGLENMSRFDATVLAESIAHLEEGIADFMNANGIKLEFYDFYAWARTDGSRISLADASVDVRDGQHVHAINLIDYVGNGSSRQDFNGRIAIMKGSHNLDFRNNGEGHKFTGLFDFSQTSYLSVRDLKPGNTIVFDCCNSLMFLSASGLCVADDPEQKEVQPGDFVVSGRTYKVKDDFDGSVNVDLRTEHYSAIHSITIKTLAVKKDAKTTKRKGAKSKK